jgi:hypothetical protein
MITFSNVKKFFIIMQSAIGLFVLNGWCTGLERSEKEKLKKKNAVWEYVYRRSDEIAYPLYTPLPRKQEPYPWEEEL